MASIKDQIRVAYQHDGKDHLNVSPFGVTMTGRLAFPEWRSDFYIPHLGEFISPRAFANWCVSGGDEELRRYTGFYENRATRSPEFRTLMLYAKFFQLTARRPTLVKESAMLDVPWMMYKKHLTGIREHHIWEEYPGIVKAFAAHLVEKGNKEKFDFDAVVPGLTETVNSAIRAFAGDDFVGIEKLDEIRKIRNEQREQREQAVAERNRNRNRGQGEEGQRANNNGYFQEFNGQGDATQQPEVPVAVPELSATEMETASAAMEQPAVPLVTIEHEARREQLSAEPEPADEEPAQPPESKLTGVAEDAQVA